MGNIHNQYALSDNIYLTRFWKSINDENRIRTNMDYPNGFEMAVSKGIQ